MDNNKTEKQSPQNKTNPDNNQNKKDIFTYIKSIQNILDKKLNATSLKAINKEISQNLKEMNNLLNKIINDKENNNNNNCIKNYEPILKKQENTIRGLYGDLLHEKLLKEILEEKIILLLQTQSEYELVKEKTGVIVCDGKIICNERKDNEIMILRTENSTLKNVINEKEKEIHKLNEKIRILRHDIIKLKKNKTNINININDINNPHTTSKKDANKFITISRSKEKQVLFNTIYSPGYSSQKEITINNFSSSTKNFYKSYHMNTNIINNNINNQNKSLDKSMDKSINNKDINININSRDNTIVPSEKLISVNKSKYNNQKNSRNKNFHTNNYSSCENILNENRNKYIMKSNRNSNNNLVIKKSNEKKISRKTLFSPLQEYNSVKYINSFNNKEGYIPRTNRDSYVMSHNNMNKQNTNINSLISSKYRNGNSNVNTLKKNDKNSKKFNVQKTGYVKRKKIPLFRNDIAKENYSVLFHRTYNENFGAIKK
jgi:hypothetical protein